MRASPPSLPASVPLGALKDVPCIRSHRAVPLVLVLVWWWWWCAVRFGSVRFGLVWFGLVWFGLVWFGLVWSFYILRVERCSVAVREVAAESRRGRSGWSGWSPPAIPQPTSKTYGTVYPYDHEEVRGASWHAMPCHAMPCHAMACYAMSCDHERRGEAGRRKYRDPAMRIDERCTHKPRAAAHTTPTLPHAMLSRARRLMSDPLRPLAPSRLRSRARARARALRTRRSFAAKKADGVPFRHFGGKFGHPQAGRTSTRGTPASTAPNTARSASRLPTPGGGGAALAAFGAGGGAKSALPAFGGGGAPGGGFAAFVSGGVGK